MPRSAGKPNSARLEEFRDTRDRGAEDDAASRPPRSTPTWKRRSWRRGCRTGQKALGADDPFVKAALAGPDARRRLRRPPSAARSSPTRPSASRSSRRAPRRSPQSDDPMIALARRVNPVMREFRAWIEQNITNVETTSGERIAKARFAAYGKTVYPDANSTRAHQLRHRARIRRGHHARSVTRRPSTASTTAPSRSATSRRSPCRSAGSTSAPRSTCRCRSISPTPPTRSAATRAVR